MKTKFYLLFSMVVLLLSGCSNHSVDSVDFETISEENLRTESYGNYNYYFNEKNELVNKDVSNILTLKELNSKTSSFYDKFLYLSKGLSDFKYVSSIDYFINGKLNDSFLNINVNISDFNVESDSFLNSEILDELSFIENIFRSESYRTVNSGKTSYKEYIGKESVDILLVVNNEYGYFIDGLLLSSSYSGNYFINYIDSLSESELSEYYLYSFSAVEHNNHLDLK